MLERLEERFRRLVGQGDFCSLRFVRERSEVLAVRQNIVQPMETSEDRGAMLTVYAGDSIGYAATGNVSLSGLKHAAEQARSWALQSAGRSVVDFSKMRTVPPTGEYATHELVPWRHTPLSDKIDLLRTECARLKTDDRIVDWEASLWYTETDTLYLTTDGSRVYQHLVYLVPMLSTTANAGSETQTRTFGGSGNCRQGA